MKFLVINTFSKTKPSLPQTTLKKMWDETLNTMEQYRKAGTILEMYFIPGWNKVVSIEDHKSADTLLQILSGHPFGNYMNFEVYPLEDFSDELLKVLAKMFKVEV